MPSTQGFTRRVKDRQAQPDKRTIHFFLETTDEDEDGNEFVVRHDDFYATMPSRDQLLIMMAEGGRESATIADEMGAMLDMFKAMLPADQYKVLYRRFKDDDDVDVDFDALREIFEWLVEQWQDFPTQSPGVSSGSGNSSGKKSTGRVRGKGSIPST